jgi:hypothetical protein
LPIFNFSTITITYHLGLVQQASSGRSTQSPTEKGNPIPPLQSHFFHEAEQVRDEDSEKWFDMDLKNVTGTSKEMNMKKKNRKPNKNSATTVPSGGACILGRRGWGREDIFTVALTACA